MCPPPQWEAPSFCGRGATDAAWGLDGVGAGTPEVGCVMGLLGWWSRVGLAA